jgi:hypothetical protein
VSRPVTAKGRKSTWRGSTAPSMSVGQTDRFDHGLADVVRRVSLHRAPTGIKLALAGMGPNGDAIAARLTDRLDHQFVEMIQGIGQALILAADMGVHIGQNGVFIEVVANDARHIGIGRLVVGNAGADGVRERYIALAIGTDQAGNTCLTSAPTEQISEIV